MSMTIQQAIENRERCLAYLTVCGPKATPENVEAVKMSIAALKKSLTTKVTHNASLAVCCTCPSCSNVVDEFEEFVPGQRIRVQAQWCKFCGQALKWEE